MRANPLMLDKEGISQYICVSEEKLESGYDKIMCIVLKQTLMQIESRTTTGSYCQTMLYWDEYERLSESVSELRGYTSSCLKVFRSKHASIVLCVQNLDSFKKEVIYDILSNIHYVYVLASNNANSLIFPRFDILFRNHPKTVPRIVPMTPTIASIITAPVSLEN